MSIEQFKQTCLGRLNGKDLFAPANSNAQGPGKSLEGFQRSVLAVAKPESMEEVQLLVELANQFKIPLYPIGQGKNWGFGSTLPVRDGCVIVHLERMNRIREINLEQGYAIIEPGVTQRQLAKALKDADCPYYLDVTGAGENTSVLGNALERGIAYNSLRAETLSSLEVVLGSGKLIRTGFGHFPESRIASLFRHGTGPSLDGLFFQSNYGIVTSATIHLLPKAEAHKSLSIQVSNEKLPELIDRLSALLKKGVIQGIPHIGNSERIATTFAPLVERRLKEQGRAVNRSEVEASLAKLFPPGWSGVASLRGSRAAVAIAQKEVRRALRGMGRMIFMGQSMDPLLRAAIPLVLGRAGTDMMDATQAIRNLTYGQPSNDGIAAVQWSTHPGSKVFSAETEYGIEEGPRGFLFCTPLAPLCGASAIELRNTADSIAAQYGFKAGTTLNIITDRILEAVISVSFDRESPEETEKAQRCIREMTRSFIDKGFNPYRVSIDLMNEVVDPADPYWQLVAQLKEVFDPNRIIAPGRYNLE